MDLELADHECCCLPKSGVVAGPQVFAIQLMTEAMASRCAALVALAEENDAWSDTLLRAGFGRDVVVVVQNVVA